MYINFIYRKHKTPKQDIKTAPSLVVISFARCITMRFLKVPDVRASVPQVTSTGLRKERRGLLVGKSSTQLGWPSPDSRRIGRDYRFAHGTIFAYLSCLTDIHQSFHASSSIAGA
ncbi:hypothetical protein EVAR_51404_1 [Eumeta japonica]|uniref:Uncharacterized protein n=1 Tax=Eumeta variegata TaxID=151549 RepID=A0A4C1XW51_EUMVA|nr:hypothetical protein EVAR_51404_1 [Eumeta japonica]